MALTPTKKAQVRTFDQLWLKPDTKQRVARYAERHGLKLYRAADLLLNSQLDALEAPKPTPAGHAHSVH